VREVRIQGTFIARGAANHQVEGIASSSTQMCLQSIQFLPVLSDYLIGDSEVLAIVSDMQSLNIP
jgi:hypothetical protein